MSMGRKNRGARFSSDRAHRAGRARAEAVGKLVAGLADKNRGLGVQLDEAIRLGRRYHSLVLLAEPLIAALLQADLERQHAADPYEPAVVDRFVQATRDARLTYLVAASQIIAGSHQPAAAAATPEPERPKPAPPTGEEIAEAVVEGFSAGLVGVAFTRDIATAGAALARVLADAAPDEQLRGIMLNTAKKLDERAAEAPGDDGLPVH